MHPTSLQQVRPTDVKQTEPTRGCCIGPLAACTQWSSTNRRHPLAQQSERMSKVWSAETLQVCHGAGVVVLADAHEFAACWP
jgi:hypothetical protein